MTSILVLATLLLVAAVVLLRSPAWSRRLPLVGAAALVLGILVFVFFAFAPKDYLVRWPSLSAWLHPFQLVWYSGALLLFGVGTLVGSAVKAIFRRRRDHTARADGT